TEESDLHAAKLPHDRTLCATERLARSLVDHVRRDPAKLRLSNALREDVWPEVELVIAVRRIVETDRVPRFDHLRALVSDRLDRRRDRVAGHEQERVWVLLLDRLPERQNPTETAGLALIDRRKLVDVVNLKERDFDVAPGFLLRRNAKERGDEKDQSQRRSARVHHTGVHYGDLESCWS